MENLKQTINEYREIDEQLRLLNKEVYRLREKRNLVESDMIQLLQTPQFVSYDKVEIKSDGSKLVIKRPLQWSKPWSLSKKDLQDLLLTFFGSDANKAAECYTFILQKQAETLRSSGFSIERVVPKMD